MKYIISQSNNPYKNLALEEILFKEMRGSILYLWQNDNTIVVGKNQNTFEEINANEVENRKINVVRRGTGGGAVYHDMGNLNFSVIVDIKEGEVYEYASFLKPVISALRSFNINASLQGRNDLVVDGLKISGNAQMISNNRVLHHGTLLVDSNLSVLSSVLNVSKNKLRSKGIKSVKSRVCNLSDISNTNIDIKKFESRIIEEYCGRDSEELILNNIDKDRIEKLANEKYSSYLWVYGQSPKSNYSYEKKFAFGSICVNLNIEKGLILNCSFSGDFLDTRDIMKVSKALEGTKYLKKDVLIKLNELKINEYLPSLNINEFVEMFFQS